MKHLLLLAAFGFLLSDCKKINTSTRVLSEVQFQNDAFDPGYYTMTEVGPRMDSDANNYINGYTDKLSYKAGDSIAYFLSGPAPGLKQLWIRDANNVNVYTISVNLKTQVNKNKKAWVDGFGYDKTLASVVPPTLKLGIYFLNSLVPIICKSSTLIPHDITVVFPSNTINAYNQLGGKSLYRPAWGDRATVVSFDRPYKYSTAFMGIGLYKWLATQQYDVNYISDEDLQNYSEIANCKVVIIAGHSEYWTKQARENVDRFVASGKNLLVLSGNTMWWQVRYNTPKHLMIGYKDFVYDPIQDPTYETINWSKPMLQNSIISSIGADFIHGGYGKQPGGFNGYKIVKDSSPVLKNTGLRYGDTLYLPSDEYDGVPVVKILLPGSTETPVIDSSKVNFYKIELLGYEYANNDISDGKSGRGMGTFIVFQKTPVYGTVVNVATPNWCTSETFYGPRKIQIQQITKNMIDASIQNQSMFTR